MPRVSTTSRVSSKIGPKKKSASSAIIYGKEEEKANLFFSSGGISDAELTNHGILQTTRLASHLYDTYGAFSHVFSSDLQRARRTGAAIADQQNGRLDEATVSAADVCFVRELPVLREQDFGSLERQPWTASRQSFERSSAAAASKGGDGGKWVAPESKESLRGRAEAFVDEYLFPLLGTEATAVVANDDDDDDDDDVDPRERGEKLKVAVVSHGMLLSQLWKVLLARCRSWKTDVKLAPEVEMGPRGLEHLGAWSNTGFLELAVQLKSFESSEDALPGNALDSTRYDATSSRADGEELDKPSQNHGLRLSQEDNKSSGSAEPPNKAEKNMIKINIRHVNQTAHLRKLKKTRGGIGSSAHDDKQQSIDTFFKRRRTEK